MIGSESWIWGCFLSRSLRERAAKVRVRYVRRLCAACVCVCDDDISVIHDDDMMIDR